VTHALVATLVAALVLTVSPNPERGRTEPDVRIVRVLANGPRFVRLTLDVEIAGVRGHGTRTIDLRTGRFADRVTAGPLSYGAGFDGATVWTSDATGMPLAEGNAVRRSYELAARHLFGRTGPEQLTVLSSPARAGTRIVRVRVPGQPVPTELTLRGATELVDQVDDAPDGDHRRARFSAYRRVAGVTLPFEITTTTRYTTRREHVRRVEILSMVARDAFAPPPVPQDVELNGTTTIALRILQGSPVVPIRIDDGPSLLVTLDSGSTNYLTAAAARRIRLATFGTLLSGGVGPGLVREREATARTLRIGGATLHDQPFSVLDYDDRVDGVIGCELFQRLAVELDFSRRRIVLARDARALGAIGTAVSMRLNACVPEVDGEVDGIRGPFAIDTGSAYALDVMSPVVRKLRLVERYHTRKIDVGGTAIGGKPVGFSAVAKRIRLGGYTIDRVPMVLDAMTSGALNDPTGVGNVGTPLLRLFAATTFDYRAGRIWFKRYR
jgi:Aspartyl protease